MMKFLAYVLVLGGGSLVLLLIVSWWAGWIGIYPDRANLRDDVRKSVIRAVPVLLFFAVFAYLRNASLSSFVAIAVGTLVFMLLFIGACTIYLRR
jgi:hypothetical protein